MRVLVTGADGFIGTKLCGKLREKGFIVLTHTIKDSDISQALPDYEDVGWVIHLAALTSITDSWNDPHKYYMVNVLGTVKALEVCRRNSCGMTFMSTYVYGKPEYLPVDEKHPINPGSPYNHSKLLAEEICNFYNVNFKVPAVILRPFNIYGPGQSSGFVLPYIINQAFDSTKNEISLENLEPKRDYIYVDDVIEMIMLSTGRKDFVVYNLGTGISTSVGELAEIVMKISGVKKPVISLNKERTNEIVEIYASIKKVSLETGWAPKVSLVDGIKKTISGNKQ